METASPPRPAIDLSSHLYYQHVYTLTDLLPPPLDDTPEALHTRNHAAIAKVAALYADQRIADNVSENGTNSQDAAFETWLSKQPWNSRGLGEPDLCAVVCEALAKSRLAHSRLAGRELPANGRASPGSAD